MKFSRQLAEELVIFTPDGNVCVPETINAIAAELDHLYRIIEREEEKVRAWQSQSPRPKPVATPLWPPPPPANVLVHEATQWAEPMP